MDEFQMILLQMINKIEKRPELYIRKKSITNLRIFLDGFTAGYFYPGTGNVINGFQGYIENKYNYHNTPYSWDYIILNQVNGTEDKALELFFEDLKSFLKEIT